MPRKVRINALITSGSKIPPINLDEYDKRISFSLKFLSTKQSKFNFDSKDSQYFLKVIDKLKSYSSLSVLEAKTNRNASLRCHPIKWEDTTELGFSIPREDEICMESYQFTISANEHGRVHGFFINSVFYIVWLDPDHELYL